MLEPDFCNKSLIKIGKWADFFLSNGEIRKKIASGEKSKESLDLGQLN